MFLTQDGSVVNSVKMLVCAMQPHLMKFAAFAGKNTDFPFPVKHKVMDAAFLYSTVVKPGLGTA